MNLARYRCSVKQHRQPVIVMTANLAEVRIILETTSGHSCVCLHCGAGSTAVPNAGDPSGSSDIPLPCDSQVWLEKELSTCGRMGEWGLISEAALTSWLSIRAGDGPSVKPFPEPQGSPANPRGFIVYRPLNLPICH